jgi:hypothetical protein
VPARLNPSEAKPKLLLVLSFAPQRSALLRLILFLSAHCHHHKPYFIITFDTIKIMIWCKALHSLSTEAPSSAETISGREANDPEKPLE